MKRKRSHSRLELERLKLRNNRLVLPLAQLLAGLGARNVSGLGFSRTSYATPMKEGNIDPAAVVARTQERAHTRELFGGENRSP